MVEHAIRCPKGRRFTVALAAVIIENGLNGFEVRCRGLTNRWLVELPVRRLATGREE